MGNFSQVFIFIGITFIILGILFSSKIAPFGKLAGDIIIERPGFSFYFPLATMIAVSIILTLLFRLLKR